MHVIAKLNNKSKNKFHLFSDEKTSMFHLGHFFGLSYLSSDYSLKTFNFH